MTRTLLGAFVLLSVSCAHFRAPVVLDVRQQESERSLQEQEINQAEKLLAKTDYSGALTAFRDFQKKYPTSIFVMASRLGEAQSLEGLGEWSQAAALEREVSLATLKEQPALAALSLYRLSYSYAEIGQEDRAAAALLDAQRLGKHLPMQIREVEIPGRLAAFYASQNRDREAALYLNDAEKGVDKVMKDPPTDLPADWLSKTYYQMGSLSISQLSPENFAEFLRGERMVQVYLLKALKLNDKQWSEKSANYLKNMYRELNRLVTSSARRDQQVSMASAFYDLIEGADLYRPLKGERRTIYENDFYNFLSEIRKKTEEVLYSTHGGIELTEESQRLNGLKRAGRVKVDSLLPQEPKSSISLPPKIVPSEDPNL